MNQILVEETLTEVIKSFKEEYKNNIGTCRFHKTKPKYGGYKFQVDYVKGEIDIKEQSISATLEVARGVDKIPYCLEYLKMVADALGFKIVSINLEMDYTYRISDLEEQAKAAILDAGWKQKDFDVFGLFYVRQFYYDFTNTIVDIIDLANRISTYVFIRHEKDSLFERDATLLKGRLFAWKFEYKGFKGIISIVKEGDFIYVTEETTGYKKQVSPKTSMIRIVNEILEDGLQQQSLQLLIKPSFKYFEARLSSISVKSHEMAEKMFETLIQERDAIEVESYFSKEYIHYESYVVEGSAVLLTISSYIFVFYAQLPDTFSVFSVSEIDKATAKFQELIGIQGMHKREHAIERIKIELNKKGKLNI
ncbi:hypothetical protein COA01_15970 [Bacillus cereus]|uniref:hypothetical protein n=1 Tax=Bacillus cereus TaxID=1396 RepID=UPI000BFBE3CF|nr:hypothetical protein [Bacillus cereus]PGP21035.1 hypothetical protein COA01_15970 [Bacillus cereus]